MQYTSVSRLLRSAPDQPTAPCYAIVDCAATEADSSIYSKIYSEDVEKHILFTGETAWANDHVAPYLLPLDSQPELEKWLVENGHGVFFTSEADIKTLLAHFKEYLEIEAPNGRNVFFRFYDPVILFDFLSVLSEKDGIAFFGPVTRFVMENEAGEPASFDKPQGDPEENTNPSKLVLKDEYKSALSGKWQRRLLDQHVQAFEGMGFKAVADPAANSVTIEDKAGKTSQIKKTGKGVEVITGEERRFQYELSSCLHPTKITDPAGNIVEIDMQERHNIDAPDAPSTVTAIRMDGGEKTWVFDYDELHHLNRIDFPDDTHAKITHNGFGHLTGYTDRNGNTRHIEYDLEERLTNYKDANGHSTRFEYDDLTAPSTIAFADGNTFNFKYTDACTLEKFLAGNTKVADYEVDQEAGSWKVNYTDGGHAEFVVQDDRIIKATNETGTVELAYDDNGALIKETFQNRSVTYHRNETGQLTGITTPFGKTIQYTRDKEDRVISIKDWTGSDIGVKYALNGALESITYPNETKLEQKTNNQGMPIEIELSGPEGTLFYKKFQRDALNRVTRIINGQEHIDYAYDKEGRLLGALSNNPDRNETFTLDAKANRLADNNRSYKITSTDRLAQVGSYEVSYDDLGNLTQGTSPRGKADYTFTDLNKLKSISLKDTGAQYIYDAFGRRVAKKVNGVTTRFYWALDHLIHEAQVNYTKGKKSAGIADYLYFPETPVLLAIRQDRQTRYVGFGHRNEVLCLTNKAGQIDWQAEYDAFGKARITTGPHIHQPIRLPGQYYDEESGLHYNIARYYDPSLGRFLSLDPLFLDGGGDNFYAYCMGDPINYVDPHGELALMAGLLIGAAVCGAITAGFKGYAEYRRQKDAKEPTDGWKIAGAALTGFGIGFIGGLAAGFIAVAAAPTTAVSGVAGLMVLAGHGFLTGAGGAAAEHCAQASLTGTPVDYSAMTKDMIIAGFIGAGLNLLVPFSAITASTARRAASKLFKSGAEESVEEATQQSVKNSSRKLKAETQNKATQETPNANKSQCADPVNAVTGEVTLSQTDFTLPGRIPLTWTRNYGSQSDYSGLLGPGWQTPADARLETDEKGMVTFYDGSPGGAVFEKLPDAEPVIEASDGAVLSAEADYYELRLKSGLTYHFPKSFSNNLSHVARIRDESGGSLIFSRKNGMLTKISDNSGQSIQVQSQRGRILAMQLDDKPLVSYRYEGGRLKSAMDALGHRKGFKYEDGHLVRHIDKNKLSFFYKYDGSGRCTHAWGDNSLYDYRFDHRPYERSVVVTDSLGNEKTFVYDKYNQPIKEQDHTGAQITYEYDDVGRTIKVTDPLERTTEYIYDEDGNVLEIIQPDDNHIAMAYDENHRPVKMLDPNGSVWQQHYDDKGRLIEKISPLQGSIQYSYNERGDLETVIDPEGGTTTFDYDDHGLVAGVIANNKSTRYQRNKLGNITAVIDPAGQTTRYVYDAKSRLIQSVLPSGNEQYFEWDPEDNLILHTDPNGLQTRYEYGGLNEIVKRINADGTTVSYDYDTEENLISVTNEKNETHRFAYDHAGRVTAQTDYYGQSTQYSYDPAGQLIKSLDPLQRTIAYEYDQAGRLQAKTFESEEQETFNWDANGNLLAVESPDALVDREYDAANNLIQEKCGDFTVQYQYDKSGRPTRRTTSHGNTVQYGYDATGATATIQINGQEPVTIERNQQGQIAKEGFTNYLNRTYEYNEDGLLTRQTINGAEGQIYRNYAYDAAANLVSKQDSQKGAWRFTHDPMGRITEALDPENQTQRFTYDPAGDLLEHMEDLGQDPRCAKFGNSLYQYDAAGNLTDRQTGEDDHTRFIWDEQNRLKTVRKSDDSRITMTYDALGRRRTKIVNGKKTVFNWDSDALLSEQHEDEAPREYVYYPGTFEPLAVIDAGGQVYYYHNDINGLPQELTNPNGTTVWSATYDAMGRVDQILVDTVAQPLRMQGQYYDPEIDLCYNRYRYFDPQSCTFISQDPLGLAAGENVYAYGPNVWQWIDPLGLCNKKVPTTSTGRLNGGEDFDLALGLSTHRKTYDPTLLKNFAKRVNAKTYGDLYGGWGFSSMDELESNIIRSMKESKSIKVNLDGMAKNIDELPSIVNKGSRGIEPMEVLLRKEKGNITNWEVYTIETNPSLKAKTTYYIDGKPAS